MSLTKDEDIDIKATLNRWKRFLVTKVQWITGIPILVILVLMLLNGLNLPIVELLSGLFGIAEPSFGEALILILVFFIVHMIVKLEDRVGHPPLQSFETKVEAYRILSKLIQERGAKRIDLIQFSGQTALPLLRDIAETWPQAQVRLLLNHPDNSEGFDTDGKPPDHKSRISASIDQITIIEEDYKNRSFSVDISYYHEPASVSAVVVDNDLVTIGWYYYYRDKEKGILRLRGHNAPTVLTSGTDGRSLREFAVEQFNKLLSSSESARAEDSSQGK